MYLKHHNGELSTVEEFHANLIGTLDPDNRWVLISSLMPWQDLLALFASVQPDVWRSRKAYKIGLWCAVHQAAA
jgi:hypothetical protein